MYQVYQLTQNRVQSQQLKNYEDDCHLRNSSNTNNKLRGSSSSSRSSYTCSNSSTTNFVHKRKRNSTVLPITAMEEEPTVGFDNNVNSDLHTDDKENNPAISSSQTTTEAGTEMKKGAEETEKENGNGNATSANNTPTNKITKPKSTKPRVKFADIEIRQYNRILGDNPGCMTGPPLQLDWSYGNGTDDITRTTIDDYETNRLPRRTRRQLVMTTVTRRNMMVYHFGCSHDEVDEAARGIKKIRKQRAKTKTLSPAVERRQEVVECISRKMKKAFLLGGSGGFDARAVYGYGNMSVNVSDSGAVLLDKKNVISAYETVGNGLSSHLVTAR